MSRNPREPNTMPDSFPTGPRGFSGGSDGPKANITRTQDGHKVPWYGADSGFIPDGALEADDNDSSFINHDD